MEAIFSAISSSAPFTMPSTVEYFFVLVGVFTGSLFACDRRLDFVGTVSLGLLVGYGGGIIRDLLLQSHGVYFVEHPSLVVVSVVLSLTVFCFRGAFRHLSASVTFFDAVSVSLFAVAGGTKAIACGCGFVMSTMLAVITAVGGGTLRDIAVGETPSIFKGSNYYAVAALISSFLFVGTIRVGGSQLLAIIICVASMLLVRYLSLYFDWKTHVDTDFSSRLWHSLKRFGHYLIEHSAYGTEELSQVYGPQNRAESVKEAMAACGGDADGAGVADGNANGDGVEEGGNEEAGDACDDASVRENGADTGDAAAAIVDATNEETSNESPSIND